MQGVLGILAGNGTRKKSRTSKTPPSSNLRTTVLFEWLPPPLKYYGAQPIQPLAEYLVINIFNAGQM